MKIFSAIWNFIKMIFLSAAAMVVLLVIFPFIPHKVVSLFRLYIVETDVPHTSRHKDALLALLEEKDLSKRVFDEGVYRSDENNDRIAIWFKTRQDAILFELKVGSGEDLARLLDKSI